MGSIRKWHRNGPAVQRAPDGEGLSPDGERDHVRLHILTRETLGGPQTDLSSQPIPGLYAAGEVAGFGGGGMHGYRTLEGTFPVGRLFSGRIAGRAVADNV